MSVRYPTCNTKYPPNETLAARQLWELATRPKDGVIPAGTLFVERWSNGHYGPPETNDFELLTTDNIGSGFTCERRVLVPPAPSRPEGAEGVETALLDADEAGFFNIAPRAIQDLADWLAAERGVRVVTEEER